MDSHIDLILFIDNPHILFPFEILLCLVHKLETKTNQVNSAKGIYSLCLIG